MYYLRIFLLMTGIWLLMIDAMSADTSLQEQIDRTPAGETLVIENGIYNEPIDIRKPIRIVAKDEAMIVYDGEEAAVSINGNDVSIDNLTVKASENATAAVSVIGEGHSLTNMKITTATTAINLYKARHVLVEGTEIIGQAWKRAVNLDESDDNILRENIVKNVEDGFYVEDSHRNLFTENEVKQARYGFHIMYSQEITLTENDVQNSYTGAMIMGADGALIKRNILKNNNENVNAQGLLIYESRGVMIRDNELINNRIGLMIEKSLDNQVKDNFFSSNYIAIQFLRAADNEVSGNHFQLNLNEAQAIESSRNTVSQNFWDSSVKIDVDQDGYGDLAYEADPYFLSLTDEVPEYQLFFQSPGMSILQKMLKSTDNAVLADTEPLMKPEQDAEGRAGSPFIVWVVAFVMLGLSVILFLAGRKKS